jgi:hypothetical protein
MRPNTVHDPAIELIKKPADVGFCIVVPPSANDRVDLIDQRRCAYGRFSTALSSCRAAFIP